jgi:hypothetical protein
MDSTSLGRGRPATPLRRCDGQLTLYRWALAVLFVAVVAAAIVALTRRSSAPAAPACPKEIQRPATTSQLSLGAVDTPQQWLRTYTVGCVSRYETVPASAFEVLASIGYTSPQGIKMSIVVQAIPNDMSGTIKIMRPSATGGVHGMTFDVPVMVLVQITGTSLTQDCPQGNERDLVYMKVGRFSGKVSPEWNNETTQFLTLYDALWTFTDEKVHNYQDPSGTLVAAACVPGPVLGAFSSGYFGIKRLENMSVPVWMLENTKGWPGLRTLVMRTSFETFATATTTVLGTFVTNDGAGYNNDYMEKVTKSILDPARFDMYLASSINGMLYPATVRSIADLGMVDFNYVTTSTQFIMFIVSDLDTIVSDPRMVDNVIPWDPYAAPKLPNIPYNSIRPIPMSQSGVNQSGVPNKTVRGLGVYAVTNRNYEVTFMMKVPGGSDLSKYTPYVQKYAPAPVQLQYVLPE